MNRASLAGMSWTETGRIAAIEGTNGKEVNDLIAAGLRQDVRVRVIHGSKRHVLVLAGDREVALDRQTAGHVWVDVQTVR